MSEYADDGCYTRMFYTETSVKGIMGLLCIVMHLCDNDEQSLKETRKIA
jgi:hypothetical protein